jgi:hypothetical protein
MTTLFVSCPGAKSAQDLFDTLNANYGGSTPITTNEIKFMHDKTIYYQNLYYLKLIII